MTSCRVTSSELGRVVIPDDLPPGMSLFWTTVDFDGSLDEKSVAALLRVARELGGDVRHLETCTQVHGARSVEVFELAQGWSECEECDSLWTRAEGVALGIKIADCLPVTILDPEGLVINLHAGWRGAAAGIVPRTLNEIEEKGHALSPETRAYLGPAIQQCCFEVGEEVIDAFRQQQPYVDELVERSRPRPFLDLPGLVRRSLIDLGFPESLIHDTGLCTRCPGSIFHSFRRSGPRAGRNLAVAGR